MEQGCCKLTKTIANAENEQVIHEFLLELKRIGRKGRTVSGYRYYLQSFFVDKKDTFFSISWRDISDHFQTYHSHLEKVTYEKYLSYLYYFYDFCVRKKHLAKSPVPKRISSKQKEIQRMRDRYVVVRKPLANVENEKAIDDFLKQVNKSV